MIFRPFAVSLPPPPSVTSCCHQCVRQLLSGQRSRLIFCLNKNEHFARFFHLTFPIVCEKFEHFCIIFSVQEDNCPSEYQRAVPPPSSPSKTFCRISGHNCLRIAQLEQYLRSKKT